MGLASLRWERLFGILDESQEFRFKGEFDNSKNTLFEYSVWKWVFGLTVDSFIWRNKICPKIFLLQWLKLFEKNKWKIKRNK